MKSRQRAAFLETKPGLVPRGYGRLLRNQATIQDEDLFKRNSQEKSTSICSMAADKGSTARGICLTPSCGSAIEPTILKSECK